MKGEREMKRRVWILILVMLAAPAWAAKKVTVGQLEDLLLSLHQAQKTDAEVATQLKEVELSQELTRSAMNNMVKYVPGPLSTEQLFVLEALSADLIPPASDLPSTPAPDAAAQKALLAKAESYVNNTYRQLPILTATRTTLRFQDNMEAAVSDSGVAGSAKEVDISAGLSNPLLFFRYINSSESPVVSEHGAEQLPPGKDKTLWGANQMIALKEPPPSLGVIFTEAIEAGSIQWLRWELINGRPAAVYSFAVPKAKSALTLDICCFPNLVQTGVARFYNSMSASVVAGDEAAGGGAGGVTGNFQSATDWRNYRSVVPYHGEFFVDSGSGIVVRMITEAELAPSEVVHRVNTRIDYGPVTVGGKMLVLPVKTVVNTEVVPKGDSGAGSFTTRQTLFTSEYKNYRPGGAK
jgi:hypothetical protein